MSATNRGAERRTNDQYYTPPELALALTSWLARERIVCRPTFAVEPSAGAGAFVRAVRTVFGCAVYAVDVDPPAGIEYAAKVMRFEDIDVEAIGMHPDLVIGNPPYSHAEDHTRRALELVRPGGVVAFLLRVGFTESQGRVDFWRGPGRQLERLAILAKRPSFTGAGTDTGAYGFFVFRRSFTGQAIVEAGWVP